jgi:hypothetical protein
MCRRIEVLQPFSLAYGIDRKYHETALGQRHPYRLIIAVRLTITAMPSQSQDSRIGFPPILWDIDIGGYIEIRQTLVDQLLDLIVGMIYRPGYLGMERSFSGNPPSSRSKVFSM